MPYAGIKDSTHEIGFVIVMNTIIRKQRSALAFSIPPSIVIGLVKTNTSRQLAIMTISESHDSFLI